MSRKSHKDKVDSDFKPVSFDRRAPDKKVTPVNRVRDIPVGQIFPDPEQPRKRFDEDKIGEMAQTIKEFGIIEPIAAIKTENGYQIITGERRYRAGVKAGLQTLPIIIKDIREDQILILQLIENLQKEDLNPVEEAKALKRLSEQGMNQTEIASKTGKSQPYISQSLSLLKLPDEILETALQEGTPKETLLKMLKKPRKKPGRPKVKPWTHKTKEYSVSIRFKGKNPERNEIIQALKQIIMELEQ